MNHFRMAAIIFTLGICIADAETSAAPVKNMQRSGAAGTPATSAEALQKIDNTVLGELNLIDGSMGAIYQAMAAVLKQNTGMAKDKRMEASVANEQRTRSAQGAIDAKKREIDQKTQAARDEWYAAITAATVSCNAVVGGVAETGNRVNALYDLPDGQRLRGFTSSTDMLKKNLKELNGSVNRLHHLLKPGRFDKTAEDDLKQLKSKFDSCFQQLRDMKRRTLERVKKRRGT